MPILHPSTFPPQLDKPALSGERAVWQALLAADIPPHVHLFYNRRPKGSHRTPDILWLDPQRGIVNIEVKGGMVHVFRKSFRQKIATYRKRIDPWLQAKTALRDMFTVLHIDAPTLPHAVILAMPLMHRTAFTFGESAHILTADDLAPLHITRKIEALLPLLPPAQQTTLAPAFAAIVAALTRNGDCAC